MSNILKEAEKFVKEQLQYDSSGHDWWHIHRVRQMAVQLAKEEAADLFVCELAALLHDVADEKLNPSKEAGMAKVENWLIANQVETESMAHVVEIIATMSYNGGHNPPMTTLEGQIVQDADRLDAMGAIGIARTFAYAGSKGNLIYDPSGRPEEFESAQQYRKHDGSAVHHFYEKLLKLKDLMNTSSGRRLAQERHYYMESFLTQFYKEWG